MDSSSTSSANFASDHSALQVGIIGAGIAGLTAAVALADSGHDVEIFEQSRFLHEVGAAINVCPNATRILNAYGFDFERARTTILDEVLFLDGKTLAAKDHVSMSHLKEEYGAAFHLLHRVDLHNGLQRLAKERQNVKIYIDTKVDSINADTGGLILRSGEKKTKDLVVVADGIHSHQVEEVAREPAINTSTGTAVYRFMVRTKELKDDERTKSLFATDLNRMINAPFGEIRLVGYPCRNGEWQNFGLFHPDNIEGHSDEVWNIPGTVEGIAEVVKELHPSLQAVCEKAEEPVRWRLVHRNKLIENLIHGRAVLIGDSAHPMLPYQGQAGAMAIEDGAALGELFKRFSPGDDIDDRLKLFQALRKDRVCAMQLLSRIGQDKPAKTEPDIVKYIHGPLPVTPTDHQRYDFEHRVMDDAKALLDTYLIKAYKKDLRGHTKAET